MTNYKLKVNLRKMTPERFVEIPQALQMLVENFALGYLQKGRKDWDEPHTRAVVEYAVDLGKKNKLDVLVLFTAAWVHDIGYNALFEDGESKEYDKVMDKKALHMVNGALLAKEFFENPRVKGWYTPEQEKRIVHLVGVHDKVEELKDLDEVVLMEADTLGAIDISKVASTFDRLSAEKYIEKDLLGRRFPKFVTKEGKAHFERLLTPFRAQYGIE